MGLMRKTEPYVHPLSKYAQSAADWALGRKVMPSTINELVIEVQRKMAINPTMSRDWAIRDVVADEEARMGSAITSGAARHRSEVMAKLDAILELYQSQQASEIVL